MEKLTKFEEKFIVYRLLIEEKRRGEKELEEISEMIKQSKNCFDVSLIAYKKDYLLKLERIIKKIKGESQDGEEQ